MNLDLFIAHLSGENLGGLYDLNKMSEDFFSVILNHVYGLNLSNLNKTGKLNFTAIDLGDVENKLSFQVTSENTKSKIKSTLLKFEESKQYLTFSKVKFLILDRTRPQKLADLAKEGNYSFTPSEDVICIKDVLLALDSLEESVINEIHEYLQIEMPLLDMVTDQSVDEEIMEVVGNIVDNFSYSDDYLGMEHLNLPEKIELNFKTPEDRDFITAEYAFCLPRFKSVTSIISAYGNDGETILQSAMYDLYNKHKHNNNGDNRKTYSDMIESIEQAVSGTERLGARRLAIKCLVMFHFEDCTIFERTESEKLIKV